MAHLQLAEESDLADRVRTYNARCQVESDRVELIRDRRQRLVCRGPLRLHWDVRVQLALVDRDGSKPLNLHYYSCAQQQTDQQPQLQQQPSPTGEAPQGDVDDDASVEVFAGVRLRRRGAKKPRQVIPVDWRRSVRGHAFTGPSSVQPDGGQSVTVLADIQETSRQVLANLFTKYMICDPPDRFCIAVLAPDGWELALGELDSPMGFRLSLGPDESRAGKLVVREAGRPSPRNSVLELARLPTPLLRHLLDSIAAEEAADVTLTRQRFARARVALETAMARLKSRGTQDDHDGDSDRDLTLNEHMSHL